LGAQKLSDCRDFLLSVRSPFTLWYVGAVRRWNALREAASVGRDFFADALGAGVVTLRDDGAFKLNDGLLRLQRHGQYPKGLKCRCPNCRGKPLKAKPQPRQPWEIAA
jgi:hypothetical protein